MSSKLAKVLLICALTVVLPLFIAGTVIAVYYSMNAATTFEIYTDSQNIDAPTISSSSATVRYDAESGTYRVINGHSKATSVEYSSEGFNFLYWFDGTHEEYVKLIGEIDEATDETIKEELTLELEGKKLSESDILSFQTGDYENITAIFNIIKYTVRYEGQEYTFEYGEALTGEGKLPVLTDTETQDFLGYIVNGNEDVIYTDAIFPSIADGEPIEITALYKDIPSFQVRYYNDGNLEFTGNSFNRNNYTTHSIESVNNYKRDGYTAIWLYNGEEFTTITEDMIANPSYDGVNYIDVQLSETPISYTVHVTGSASGTTATYRNNPTFTVSDVNITALDSASVVTNWTFGQYAWDFRNFTYNSTYYGDARDLVDAIMARNPDSANGTINITVNFTRDAETYTFNFYNGSSYLGQATALDTQSSVALPSGARRLGYQITSANIGGTTVGHLNYNHAYSNGKVTTSGGSIILPSSIFAGNTTKTINLNYTALSFTVTVSDSDYEGTTTIDNVTISNYSTRLAPLFIENNWTEYDNIQTWSGEVTVNSQNFRSTSALFNYILGNYDEGDSIVLTSDVTESVTSLTIDGVTYPTDIRANGNTLINNPNEFTITNFNISIIDEDGIFAYDLNSNFTNTSGATVEPVSFSYILEGGYEGRTTFKLSSLNGDYSIYNFLNTIYGSIPAGTTEVTLSSLVLHF